MEEKLSLKNFNEVIWRVIEIFDYMINSINYFFTSAVSLEKAKRGENDELKEFAILLVFFEFQVFVIYILYSLYYDFYIVDVIYGATLFSRRLILQKANNCKIF